MDGGELEETKILEIAKANITEFFADKKSRTIQTVRRYILDNLSYRLDDNLTEVSSDEESLLRYLTDVIRNGLSEQEENVRFYASCYLACRG